MSRLEAYNPIPATALVGGGEFDQPDFNFPSHPTRMDGYEQTNWRDNMRNLGQELRTELQVGLNLIKEDLADVASFQIEVGRQLGEALQDDFIEATKQAKQNIKDLPHRASFAIDQLKKIRDHVRENPQLALKQVLQIGLVTGSLVSPMTVFARSPEFSDSDDRNRIVMQVTPDFYENMAAQSEVTADDDRSPQSQPSQQAPTLTAPERSKTPTPEEVLVQERIGQSRMDQNPQASENMFGKTMSVEQVSLSEIVMPYGGAHFEIDRLHTYEDYGFIFPRNKCNVVNCYIRTPEGEDIIMNFTVNQETGKSETFNAQFLKDHYPNSKLYIFSTGGFLTPSEGNEISEDGETIYLGYQFVQMNGVGVLGRPEMSVTYGEEYCPGWNRDLTVNITNTYGYDTTDMVIQLDLPYGIQTLNSENGQGDIDPDEIDPTQTGNVMIPIGDLADGETKQVTIPYRAYSNYQGKEGELNFVAALHGILGDGSGLSFLVAKHVEQDKGDYCELPPTATSTATATATAITTATQTPEPTPTSGQYEAKIPLVLKGNNMGANSVNLKNNGQNGIRPQTANPRRTPTPTRRK